METPPPNYANYPRPGSGGGVGGEYPHRGPGVYFEQIGDAFRLMFKNPKVYMGAGGIVFAIGVLWYIALIVGMFVMMPKGNAASEDPSAFLAFMGLVYGSEFVVFLLANIVCAGITVCCLEDLTKGSTDFATVFSAFKRFIPLTVTTFLCMLLTFVGYCLCLAPGFYVAGVLCLAPTISVVEKLGPIDSMRRSYEVMQKHGWLMGLMIFVMYILVCAGSMACGVGLVITVPLFYVMTGFHYRDFCIPVANNWVIPNPVPNQNPYQPPS